MLECAVDRIGEQKLKDIEECVEMENAPEKYNEGIRDRLRELSVLELRYLKKWTLLLHMEEYSERYQNQ